MNCVNIRMHGATIKKNPKVIWTAICAPSAKFLKNVYRLQFAYV